MTLSEAAKRNIPLFKVHVPKEEALRNIAAVLDSGFINEGVQVTELSNSLTSLLGIENIVLTNSGTSALTIALRVAGVGMGDEVISISMTCIATNTPVINLGARIVWADIDPETGSINPEDVRQKITPKTKAILFVAWAGNPCDLDALNAIGDEFGIPLIQDAAHAFGATWNTNSIANYADYTCFSFQAIKHFTTGDGGAIVCRDEEDYLIARSLKWFGYDRNSLKDEKGEWKGQRWEADIDVGKVGYKFNMNNVSAAIGLAQINYIDDVLRLHRRNANLLKSLLASQPEIDFLNIPEFAVSSNWVFTLRLKKPTTVRNRIIQNLNDMGIGAGLVHLPNHSYTAFRESQVDLPGTDLFSSTQLSLPCGWWVKEEECEFMAESLIKQLSNSVESL